VLFSVGANGAHGQRRTNEDKRRAVLCLLGDAEWGRWNDSEIARRCGVHHSTVATLRPKPILRNPQDSEPETRKVTRNGTTYDQRVGNIGRSAPPPEPPHPAPQPRSAEPEPAWAPADVPLPFDDEPEAVRLASGFVGLASGFRGG
jgi:hypothetical protein